MPNLNFAKLQLSFKRGLCLIIRNKPRINVNPLPSRLSLRVRQWRTRQSQTLSALYQPRPHILLRKKQWGPPKSQLKVPVPAAEDTDEYHRSTSYLNHQPADYSYYQDQGQSY